MMDSSNHVLPLHLLLRGVRKLSLSIGQALCEGAEAILEGETRAGPAETYPRGPMTRPWTRLLRRAFTAGHMPSDEQRRFQPVSRQRLMCCPMQGGVNASQSTKSLRPTAWLILSDARAPPCHQRSGEASDPTSRRRRVARERAARCAYRRSWSTASRAGSRLSAASTTGNTDDAVLDLLGGQRPGQDLQAARSASSANRVGGERTLYEISSTVKGSDFVPADARLAARHSESLSTALHAEDLYAIYRVLSMSRSASATLT